MKMIRDYKNDKEFMRMIKDCEDNKEFIQIKTIRLWE